MNPQGGRTFFIERNGYCKEGEKKMLNNKKISVLVVDDSLVFRTAIANGLAKNPAIHVAGTAASAYEARDKILQLKPDVLTLDVEMPKMSGIEFLKILMPQYPMPVVVVSAVDGVVFEALRVGAVDFVEKPSGSTTTMATFTEDLANKIIIASKATVRGGVRRPVPNNTTTAAKPAARQRLAPTSNLSGLIAIGASTGGTEATSNILKVLPEKMPGLVITQHMPPVFTKMYAQRLDRESALSVKEAEDGDIVLPGHAYIAPGDKHMTVQKSGLKYVIRCAAGAKVNGHCPSVDVLFDSVAKFADKSTVGIILTGMGADGAKGLVKLRERGAYTIGQDEKSCVVYGMPMMAYKYGGVMKQASLDDIPNVLMSYLGK